MGEMRDSDWSRQNLLRSDWLGLIGAPFTTHSFCLKCLKGWYETCGGGDAIRCPKCQTFSQVPASGDLKDLPTSFYLNGLIDVLAIKECSKTQVKCGNCDQKTSVASYCLQCCIFYCEECLIEFAFWSRVEGRG